MADKYVQTYLELLNLEKDAEIAESVANQKDLPLKVQEEKGVCLLKLLVDSVHTGLFGRVIIVFKRSHGLDLPSNHFGPGDIVGVYEALSTKESLCTGLVSTVTSSSVSIAIEDDVDSGTFEDNTQYRLHKLANDVTYQRLKRALLSLKSIPPVASRRLVDVCLLNEVPSPPLISLPPCLCQDGELNFRNKSLDPSQKDAVKFSLLQKEVAVIHGPPGTGKTTTVVELIAQEVTSGKQVLVAAPSNVAVDNLVERLISNNVPRVVRLGHPARMMQDIQKHSLDAIVAGSEETQLIRDVRREIDSALKTIRKTRDKGKKKVLYGEVKTLRKEQHSREKIAVLRVLERANVIVATLTSCSDDGPLKYLKDKCFDVGVIDECSQAVEVACLIPLLRCKKMVLAGDHLQLPPTVLSKEASEKGLGKSLMEKLVERYNDTVCRMLEVQYRMNDVIMGWSSELLYESKLRSHSSVQHHLLLHLPGVKQNEITECPFLFIDTAGCNLQELEANEEMSKGNEGEAELAVTVVKQIIGSGVNPKDIAVIAPYNLQVEILRSKLSDITGLEIKSVDGFQGREKEAVVITLVRSNKKREVGFLSEIRRLNVAVTRARRHVCVIGDSETVSSCSDIQKLVEYAHKCGQVHCADQYSTEIHYEHEKNTEGNYEVHSQSSRVKAKTFSLPEASLSEKVTKFEEKYAQPISREKVELNESCDVKRATVVDQEEREVQLRKEIEEMIERFLDSDDIVKELSSKYNAFERLLFHEIAEERNLSHESVGEGALRHIVLKKLLPKIEEKEPNVSETAPSGNVIPKGYTTCPQCGKSLSTMSFDVHLINCQRQNLGQQAMRKPKENKSTKKKKKAEKTSEAAEDDIESILNDAIEANKYCSCSPCKQPVATLGRTCMFCNRMFCMKHSMPELHGCTEPARAHAKKVFRERFTQQVNDASPLKTDPIKQKQLQNSLNKKLEEMKSQRQKKSNKKK